DRQRARRERPSACADAPAAAQGAQTGRLLRVAIEPAAGPRITPARRLFRLEALHYSAETVGETSAGCLMLQDSIARGAAPRRGARHGRFLSSGCAGVALLLITLPAAAQQYGAVGTSVTVDYSVLDSMGTDSNLPALLG